MKMRYVGQIGVYHAGIGGIEQRGDFGWRLDMVDGAKQFQIALWCPKYGVCLQCVHSGPSGDVYNKRFWHWDGNIEQPTITPSIGCDTRCGQHMTITNGEIFGTLAAAAAPKVTP